MDKPILLIICAVPGSGKSYICGQSEENIKLHGLKPEDHDTYHNNGFVIHSSDDMRILLSKVEGSELDKANDQSINKEVFETLHEKVIEDLKQGKNVVLDATNISFRKELIEEIRNQVDCKIIAHQFTTPLQISLKRNAARQRVVPTNVIKNMYSRLVSDPPTYDEGFDEIYKTQNLYFNEKQISKEPTKEKELEDILMNNLENIDKTDFLDYFPELKGCKQNNPHHCYDLLTHTLEVVKNVDTPILKIAALFHDIGKVDAKCIDRRTGYDRFPGHPEYSKDLAVGYFKNHDFDKNEINKILFLIKNHDIFMNINKEAAHKKEIQTDKDFYTVTVASAMIEAIYDVNLYPLAKNLAEKNNFKNFVYGDYNNSLIVLTLGKKYIKPFIEKNYPDANDKQKEKIEKYFENFVDMTNTKIKNIDINKILISDYMIDLMKICKADVLAQADKILDKDGNIITTKEIKLQNVLDIKEVYEEAFKYIQFLKKEKNLDEIIKDNTFLDSNDKVTQINTDKEEI